MLVVQINGLLNSVVANHVAMSKVLCDDTRTRLLFLCDLIAVALSVGSEVAIIRSGRGGARNLHLSASKLCVVEEEGSLGGSFLLESDGRALSLTSGVKLELGNLTAEGKEILDLLLAGGGADVLDVNHGHVDK